MTVADIRAFNRVSAVSNSITPLFENVTLQNQLGNTGRNVLCADGIGNFDFRVIKNIQTTENHRIPLRGEFCNVTNSRNFGSPDRG